MAQNTHPHLSVKRASVDKTNTRIVMVTAGATFLVVFFLVASFSLFSKLTYQNRIISAKKTAVSQLKANLTARNSLVNSYSTFADSQQNFIGGSASGAGAQDGANPKIVLDALPSTYDFPALTASLEKLVSDQKASINNITGTDDQVAQNGQTPNDPKPIAIPFEIKVGGDYDALQRVVRAFDLSIRPIQIQTLKIDGGQDQLTVDISAQTFYQPEKTLNIRKKVIE